MLSGAINDVEQLGRVAVEIDHVARFARGLRSGIHRDAHIGLRERRSVIRPITGHGDEMAVRLFLTDPLQFLFRGRLGHEIVYTRLSSDGRSREWIIAGDHHRFDSHPAQLREAILNSAFDDVFQFDCSERHHIRGNDQGCAAPMGNLVDCLSDWLRENSAG